MARVTPILAAARGPISSVCSFLVLRNQLQISGTCAPAQDHSGLPVCMSARHRASDTAARSCGWKDLLTLGETSVCLPTPVTRVFKPLVHEKKRMKASQLSHERKNGGCHMHPKGPVKCLWGHLLRVPRKMPQVSLKYLHNH